MKYKNLIIIIIAILAIIFIALWLFKQPGVRNVKIEEKGGVITDSNVKVLTSSVVDTEKDIYSPGENIIAFTLIKNEFEEKKAWKLVVSIKAPGDDKILAQKSKEITLNPEEIKRQDIEISTKNNKLSPGEYSLELSIRENNQEISLKTVAFEVR